MNEIAFFSDKIQEINRELGISNATGFLEDTQEHLTRFANTEALPVDIYRVENSSSKIKNIIQSWCSSPGVKANVITPINFNARSITTTFPAIAVCCLDNEMNAGITVPVYIASLYEQYKVVIIVNFLEELENKKTFIDSLGYRIKIKQLNGIDLQEGKTLYSIIEDTVTPTLISVLKTLANLNKVRPTVFLVNQILQTENKMIQTRKILSNQNQLITRKDEQSLNNMDLANNIRQAIQKFSNDMDKSLRSKYEEFNKPVTGYYTKHVAELAEQLTDFKRTTVAEKDEKEEIKLTDDYQDLFLGSVKKKVGSEMKKDAEFLTTSVNELLNRVNNILASKNISPISIDSDIVEFPSIGKSITPYCQFSKVYKSEMMKKGTTEYFVALRDYTGVIMVATGLLAPLTIIAGLESKEMPFLQTFSRGIKLTMACITIVLIIYGAFDLRKKIPLKRKEEFIREVEKAREFVLNEGKRIGNEVSRDWVTATGSWTKDISQLVASAFEKRMKDTQQNKAGAINQDKAQQQRRQQNIDAQQRSITNADRIKDALNNKLRDMYQEAEKKIISI